MTNIYNLSYFKNNPKLFKSLILLYSVHYKAHMTLMITYVYSFSVCPMLHTKEVKNNNPMMNDFDLLSFFISLCGIFKEVLKLDLRVRKREMLLQT